MADEFLVVEQDIAVVVACAQKCVPSKCAGTWIISCPKGRAIDQHPGRFHSCRDTRPSFQLAIQSNRQVSNLSQLKCKVILWSNHFEVVEHRKDLLNIRGRVADIVI